ncbi:MAG: DUF975 family protein [Clostridia bacterium]
MNSFQIRKEARTALKGNWVNALLVCLIMASFAFIMGVIYDLSTMGIQNELLDLLERQGANQITDEVYLDLYQSLNAKLILLNVFNILATIAGLLFGLANANYFLRLAETNNGRFDVFTSYFKYVWRSFCLYLLMTVKICLWSLLLVIPGIIKSFSYSMAPYIKADNLDLSAAECIDRSKNMMKGQKGALFGLGFSFIGWILLTALVYTAITMVLRMVLGLTEVTTTRIQPSSITALSAMLSIPLTAYIQTATAKFYLALKVKLSPIEEQSSTTDEKENVAE